MASNHGRDLSCCVAPSITYSPLFRFSHPVFRVPSLLLLHTPRWLPGLSSPAALHLFDLVTLNADHFPHFPLLRLTPPGTHSIRADYPAVHFELEWSRGWWGRRVVVVVVVVVVVGTLIAKFRQPPPITRRSISMVINSRRGIKTYTAEAR